MSWLSSPIFLLVFPLQQLSPPRPAKPTLQDLAKASRELSNAQVEWSSSGLRGLGRGPWGAGRLWKFRSS